jgi:hypothetical protein
MMIVMPVVIRRVIVMRGGGTSVATMRIVMVLDGIAGGIARMGAEDGDEARENGAQQRQKDDCLKHAHAPLRTIS